MDRDLIKAVVGLAVSAGVGVVVKNAVIHTAPTGVSKTDRILMGIGTYAIGGIVSNHAIKYTDGQIDYIFNTVNDIKETRKENSTYVTEDTITVDPSDVS